MMLALQSSSRWCILNTPNLVKIADHSVVDLFGGSQIGNEIADLLEQRMVRR